MEVDIVLRSGEFIIFLPDGRQQKIKYFIDEQGKYHATISYKQALNNNSILSERTGMIYYYIYLYYFNIHKSFVI